MVEMVRLETKEATAIGSLDGVHLLSPLVRCLLGLLLACVLVLGLAPGSASAHATLVSSDPAENAFLNQPPESVSISFTEPIDARLSGLQVLDASGTEVEIGAISVSSDAFTMTAAVPQLEPGIYNVLWSNVSQIDGHGYRGSFPFTVLNADGSLPAQVNTVGGFGGESDPAPPADDVGVGALALLGLLLAAGGALLIVLLPRSQPVGGLWRAVLLGAVVLLIASLLNLKLLLDVFSGVDLGTALLDSRSGRFLITRFAAALFIGAAALLLGRWRRRSAAAVWFAAAIAAWGFAETSHGAAGSGSTWGTFFDLTHRIAALGWIGGVIGLAVTARLAGRDAVYRLLLPRFSLLASALVFVLITTGILNTLIEVDSWDRLTTTRYGLTLLVKLALLVPLLGIALYNMRWGRARLMALVPGEPRRFIATATVEVFLGLAVFAVAASLSQTTVAKSIVESPNAEPYVSSSEAGDLTVELTVDPYRMGLNTFGVALSDAEGEPVDAEQVGLTFTYLDDEAVGPASLTLTQSGPGVFTGQGPYFPLEGDWRVTAEVRRADVDDVWAYFDVQPAAAPALGVDRGGDGANPAAGLSGRDFAAIATLLGGLGVAILAARLWPADRRLSLGAQGLAALALITGSVLLIDLPSVQNNVSEPPTGPVVQVPGGADPASGVPDGEAGSPSSWEVPQEVTPSRAGDATIWKIPTPNAGLMMPAIAPDGSVWIGEMNTNKLARLLPDEGVVQEFTFPGPLAGTMGIAIDNAGIVWLAQDFVSAIGRFDPVSGEYRQFELPTENSAPSGIAVAQDGSIWFTELGGNQIGRLDPASGDIVEYQLPTPKASPYWLAIAPDGRIWFSEFRGAVGVLDPASGEVVEYPLPDMRGVAGVAVDEAGQVWFGARSGELMRLDPNSGDVTQVTNVNISIYGIIVVGGAVWVGGPGNSDIYAYATETGEVASYPMPANSGPWWPAASDEGEIWVALASSEGNALARIDP